MLKSMMILFFLVGQFVMASPLHQKAKKIETSGMISIEQRATVTCMAIGCPPSTPYFVVNLKADSGESIELHREDGLAPQSLKINGYAVATGDFAVFTGVIASLHGKHYDVVELVDFSRIHQPMLFH